MTSAARAADGTWCLFWGLLAYRGFLDIPANPRTASAFADYASTSYQMRFYFIL